MSNIILQHFTGQLRDLDMLSIKNIRAYASRIGAEYKFISGQVFRDWLTPPCQKLIMLDEQFDEYDNVVMLDIDMFVTKDLTESVFDAPGVGMHDKATSTRTRDEVFRKFGTIPKDGFYIGGAIYKFDRATRQALRNAMPDNDAWMKKYSQAYRYEDEGMIAELWYRAGLPKDNQYIDRRWCQCSFRPELVDGLIHIRTKVTPEGPKVPKIENHNRLIQQGVI